MKRKYVSIGKPIGFKIFDEWKKPTGWIRLEYLKRDLLQNPEITRKFTKSEIKKILFEVEENELHKM
jgi:hypothetical protein